MRRVGKASTPASASDRCHSGNGAGVSRWIDIDGPVHYADFGGPRRAALIICVHGLAGSYANWSALAPVLASRYRVLALDLAGHGLTRSAGRGTDVQANRLLLHRFAERVSPAPVILMGNSMGGMISLLEAEAADSRACGLILLDPALPFVLARPDLLLATAFAAGGLPALGPMLLRGVHRLPAETIVARMLAVCCQDPSRLPAEVVSQHIAIARRRAEFAEAPRDVALAIRSVIATAGPAGRSYRAGLDELRCSVLLLHGERDRLVPVSAARSAARGHPGWSLAVLPDVGHLPQLEAPSACADVIVGWLDGTHGRTGAPRRRRKLSRYLQRDEPSRAQAAARLPGPGAR